MRAILDAAASGRVTLFDLRTVNVWSTGWQVILHLKPSGIVLANGETPEQAITAAEQQLAKCPPEQTSMEMFE